MAAEAQILVGSPRNPKHNMELYNYGYHER